MKMNDLILFSSEMTRLGVDKLTANDRTTTEQQLEILRSCGSLIPRYVKLRNAENFTVEDFNYPQLYGLAVEILFRLASISTPGEDDIKN